MGHLQGVSLDSAKRKRRVMYITLYCMPRLYQFRLYNDLYGALRLHKPGERTRKPIVRRQNCYRKAKQLPTGRLHVDVGREAQGGMPAGCRIGLCPPSAVMSFEAGDALQSSESCVFGGQQPMPCFDSGTCRPGVLGK